MIRTVAAFEARRQFGRLLQQVMFGKDNIVIEWHNQPAAVLVPVDLHNRWQAQEDDAFRLLQSAATTAQMDEDEATVLAREAVTWARTRA